MRTRPRYCNEAAFDLFADQVCDRDTEGALLRAAIAGAMHEMPEVDYRDSENTVHGFADRVLARVQSDDSTALLAHAHSILFEEEGFIGNIENYHDPRNSYIPAVLESRRGNPVTLTLIYKEVLERLGLQVNGTNAPGHFMATVWSEGHPMLVDTFTRGRVLTHTEAIGRITELTGRTDLGSDALPIASNRDWIARILRNLIRQFGRSNERNSLAAVLELQGLLDFRSRRG